MILSHVNFGCICLPPSISFSFLFDDVVGNIASGGVEVHKKSKSPLLPKEVSSEREAVKTGAGSIRCCYCDSKREFILRKNEKAVSPPLHWGFMARSSPPNFRFYLLSVQLLHWQLIHVLF